MTKTDLQHESSSSLVAQFLRLAIARGDAIMGDEIAKASKLYWKIDAILKVLKSRPGDDRRLLIQLHQHPDPSVRLESATATLAIDPAASRQVLQEICNRREFPFAGYAGMRLRNLDTGVFKPV